MPRGPFARHVCLTGDMDQQTFEEFLKNVAQQTHSPSAVAEFLAWLQVLPEEQAAAALDRYEQVFGAGEEADKDAIRRIEESAADNTRDFFVTDIPWDSYNVDRVDIQRGRRADRRRERQPHAVDFHRWVGRVPAVLVVVHVQEIGRAHV